MCALSCPPHHHLSTETEMVTETTISAGIHRRLPDQRGKRSLPTAGKSSLSARDCPHGQEDVECRKQRHDQQHHRRDHGHMNMFDCVGRNCQQYSVCQHRESVSKVAELMYRWDTREPVVKAQVAREAQLKEVPEMSLCIRQKSLLARRQVHDVVLKNCPLKNFGFSIHIHSNAHENYQDHKHNQRSKSAFDGLRKRNEHPLSTS